MEVGKKFMHSTKLEYFQCGNGGPLSMVECSEMDATMSTEVNLCGHY
jgi:hypothetical protein